MGSMQGCLVTRWTVIITAVRVIRCNAWSVSSLTLTDSKTDIGDNDTGRRVTIAIHELIIKPIGSQHYSLRNGWTINKLTVYTGRQYFDLGAKVYLPTSFTKLNENCGIPDLMTDYQIHHLGNPSGLPENILKIHP